MARLRRQARAEPDRPIEEWTPLQVAARYEAMRARVMAGDVAQHDGRWLTLVAEMEIRVEEAYLLATPDWIYRWDSRGQTFERRSNPGIAGSRRSREAASRPPSGGEYPDDVRTYRHPMMHAGVA